MFLSSSATSKKKRKAPQSNQQPEDKPSYQELKKKYDTLVKDHERVGQSFQNQQPQNQELAAELEEQEKDAEELANLVQTKSEAIKTLQTKLADAKKTISKPSLRLCTNAQLTNLSSNLNRKTQKTWTKCILHLIFSLPFYVQFGEHGSMILQEASPVSNKNMHMSKNKTVVTGNHTVTRHH